MVVSVTGAKTVAILDDEEIVFEIWRSFLLGLDLQIHPVWISNLQEFFNWQQPLDLIIIDRLLDSEEDGNIDLLADGQVHRVKAQYQGPLILSSNAATPSRYQQLP